MVLPGLKIEKIINALVYWLFVIMYWTYQLMYTVYVSAINATTERHAPLNNACSILAGACPYLRLN